MNETLLLFPMISVPRFSWDSFHDKWHGQQAMSGDTSYELTMLTARGRLDVSDNSVSNVASTADSIFLDVYSVSRLGINSIRYFNSLDVFVLSVNRTGDDEIANVESKLYVLWRRMPSSTSKNLLFGVSAFNSHLG